MARPEKCKRICNLPQNIKFQCSTPSSTSEEAPPQTLSIEEFETIRLIDYIGLTQEQCAAQMHVARTTVQRMYTDARRKIATFFVTGSTLDISGGNYVLCENCDVCCQQFTCANRKCGCSCDSAASSCLLCKID